MRRARSPKEAPREKLPQPGRAPSSSLRNPRHVSRRRLQLGRMSGWAKLRSKPPHRLARGINTYAYIEGDPLSITDPLGLATYLCTKPLHAPGDTCGHGLYPESGLNPSPFYHQYVCFPDGKGGMSCGGQDRAEGPLAPGKPSTTPASREP